MPNDLLSLSTNALTELELALRIPIASVFILAGLSKLLVNTQKDQQDQRALLESVGMSSRITRFSAPLLPFAELLLGAWLLSSWYPRVSIAVSVAVLAMFTGLIWKARSVGFNGTCACFGSDRTPVGVHNLIFNALLIVTGGVASVLQYSIESLAGIASLSFIGALLTGVVGATLFAARALLGEIESLIHMRNTLGGSA